MHTDEGQEDNTEADSSRAGQGLVRSCCEYGDEHSDSIFPTNLATVRILRTLRHGAGVLSARAG